MKANLDANLNSFLNLKQNIVEFIHNVKQDIVLVQRKKWSCDLGTYEKENI